MKKNVEVITADSHLLNWAVEGQKRNLPKPQGASELLQGLQGLLDGSCSSLMIEPGDGRPGSSGSETVITCGALAIHTNTRRVFRDGQEIFLTPKEYEILALLARNRGEIFTKEQIYQAVWDDVYLMDDSNIMSFIRKIRKKIEPTPDAPRYILTIWGIGYKFSEEP